MAFEWPAGYVWRSHMGGWVTPEQALADARRRFRVLTVVGVLEVGSDPDPGYRPEQVGTMTTERKAGTR